MRGECSGRYQELAAAAGRFTQAKLSAKDKEYLRDLPLQLQLRVGQTRFWLCHAAPSDPLYAYCPPDSERWVRADTVLVGHTHMQFHGKLGNCFVVNPGSLGQPNNRSALACFAVWQDGSLSLQSTLYAVENTVAKVEEMPVPKSVQQDLISIPRSGSLPEARTEMAKLEKAKSWEF
jgi:predicted phosphodiesterase